MADVDKLRAALEARQQRKQQNEQPQQPAPDNGRMPPQGPEMQQDRQMPPRQMPGQDMPPRPQQMPPQPGQQMPPQMGRQPDRQPIPQMPQRSPMQQSIGMPGDTATPGSSIMPPEPETPAAKLDEERIKKAWVTLSKYKSGKASLDARIIECEQWWKLRHWGYMHDTANPGIQQMPSAWLFNTIISKHADAMDNMPTANVLPREEADKDTAEKLSAIIPCVLEQTGYQEVYSDIQWQKLKTGTGVYGIYWDKTKLNGLGDVTIRKINLLNLFWEPGITDIQESENVFLCESMDRERVKALWPQVTDQVLNGGSVTPRHFVWDEEHRVDADRVTIVDWYYHVYDGQKAVLHYAKLLGETLLYSSEEDPEYGERGWYDHGMYPFVFDRLFPVETSPCGFGFVDVCKHNQEQIDLLEQAMVENSLMNATPRYFVRTDGGVNEEEFADWTRPIVHVSGSMSQDSITLIQPPTLNANVISMINEKVTEMKETSGNTDSSRGTAGGGVTSASGIAALQEASGKLSRDNALASFRAFTRLVNILIELIRQFYDAPRQFRILGEHGKTQYTDFDNSMLKPESLGISWGEDDGYRLPTFDVKVSAEAHSTFTKNAANEMAMNLFNMGVFNPENVQQSMLLLNMMQFEGKDELMSKLSEYQQQQQQLMQWQQMALQLAQQVDPAMAEQMGNAIMMQAGQAPGPGGNGGGNVESVEQQNQKDPGGAMSKLQRAREAAQQRGVAE